MVVLALVPGAASFAMVVLLAGGLAGAMVVVAAIVVSTALFLLEPHAAPNNEGPTGATARSFFAWIIKWPFKVVASPTAA